MKEVETKRSLQTMKKRTQIEMHIEFECAQNKNIKLNIFNKLSK